MRFPTAAIFSSSSFINNKVSQVWSIYPPKHTHRFNFQPSLLTVEDCCLQISRHLHHAFQEKSVLMMQHPLSYSIFVLLATLSLQFKPIHSFPRANTSHVQPTRLFRPTPSSSSTNHLLLPLLNSSSHCGMIACPNGELSGHAYCRAIGCDFCMAVVFTWGSTEFECDGDLQGKGIGRGRGRGHRVRVKAGGQEQVVKEKEEGHKGGKDRMAK